MPLYIDCDWCGEEVRYQFSEFRYIEVVDPIEGRKRNLSSPCRDHHWGPRRLHEECVDELMQVVEDHRAWIQSRRAGWGARMQRGSAPLRWELVGEISEPIRPTPEGADTTSVFALGLTPRTMHMLKDTGIMTAGQLAATSDARLMAIRGFGQRSLAEVYEVLERHGIGRAGTVAAEGGR